MNFFRRLFGGKRQSKNPQQLISLLLEFIGADNWNESQRLVEAHPELLSPDADNLLDAAITAQKNPQDAAIIAEHRALLQRCRAIGVAAAFAEKTGFGSGSNDDIPPRFAGDIQAAQRAEQDYLRTSDLATLDAAGAAWERVLTHSAFFTSSAGFQLAVLNDAGGLYLRRYWTRGQHQDLEMALQLWQAAVTQTPTDSPDLPGSLNNLGTGLRDRYAHSGQLADLEAAIGVCQQAVKQTPTDSPNLPMYLNNLGNGLRDRYARSGQFVDLEEALRVFQQAVTQAPTDSPDLPMYLNNLGNGLRDRYTHSGQLADLKAAIGVFQQAVKQTPTDSPDLPGSLNNLGTGLRERYAHSGQLTDLEEALRVFEQAVTKTPTDSPDLPMYLNNLGTGLCDRYARSGQLADLEEATGVSQQVVTQTPTDSPDLPGSFNNLGNGLSERYARSGQFADLEEALHVFQQAVTQTPTDSPDLPMYLNNLGAGLCDRYARIGQLADLEEAKAVYARACERGTEVAPEEALRSARNWAGWALGRQGWSEVITATTLGRSALDRLWAIQINRAAQESILAQGQLLAAQAAYALAKENQLGTAVEAMEQGRARLLAEALEQNRADLQRLPALGHGDLAMRYQELLDRRAALVQAAERSATGEHIVDHLSGMERLAALEQNFAELQMVIDKIRQVPGYEDFFAKPAFDSIQRALTAVGGDGLASVGVYLLTTAVGGLALIVHAGGIEALWLDGLTDKALGELLRAWFAAYSDFQRLRSEAARIAWFGQIDAVTNQLWALVMGPLAAALAGHGFAPGGDQPPIVTLIPTGLLALLPLHASWTEDASTTVGRRYFLDDYAVHYAPSATALRYCRERTANHALVDRLLAIDEPQPITGGGALPNSAREVAAIADHFTVSTLLAHEQATREAVLAALPASDVAHFSCHGSNNWQSPLETGLLLVNDEALTVRDFLAAHLSAARLATLSACETGMVGTNLPDEVVMLPSALVQAGYAGVVASLWSVEDVSTAMLMVRFYEHWRADGMEPVYALRAAQQWVRDTTNREKAAYFRREITGPDDLKMAGEVAHEFFKHVRDRRPAARDFADPFWWAAFYLTGV